MPRRTVDDRFVARMDIVAWPLAPSPSARHELALDDTFRAEVHRHLPLEILRRERHEHAEAFLECRRDFRLADHFDEMRRTDFLLAFGDKHEIERHLEPRAAERVQRGEE